MIVSPPTHKPMLASVSVVSPLLTCTRPIPLPSSSNTRSVCCPVGLRLSPPTHRELRKIPEPSTSNVCVGITLALVVRTFLRLIPNLISSPGSLAVEPEPVVYVVSASAPITPHSLHPYSGVSPP